MKRVFIIHGWTGKPDEHWLPWLGNRLKEKGFEAHLPEMPDTDSPKMDLWIAYLKKEVGFSNEDTYFVGHSIGCSVILRYLEKYDEKVGGVALVAPWVTLNQESFSALEDKAIVDDWSKPLLDFNKIRSRCDNFFALFSDDDPDVPLQENRPIFENQLGAKIIVEHNKKHFTADAGVTELPVVLEELLKMAK